MVDAKSEERNCLNCTFLTILHADSPYPTKLCSRNPPIPRTVTRTHNTLDNYSNNNGFEVESGSYGEAVWPELSSPATTKCGEHRYIDEKEILSGYNLAVLLVSWMHKFKQMMEEVNGKK